MEDDKPQNWFHPEKLAKIQVRFATITSNLQLGQVVSQCKSAIDLLKQVELFATSKNIKTSLHLRELVFLSMGNYPHVEHIGIMDGFYAELCAKEPSTLLEIYCEMIEEFKVVRIDFAFSYATLIRAVLNRQPGILETPCFSEVQLTEGIILKKIAEIEGHYNRVVEQERQCRSHDVIRGHSVLGRNQRRKVKECQTEL